MSSAAKDSRALRQRRVMVTMAMMGTLAMLVFDNIAPLAGSRTKDSLTAYGKSKLYVTE